jgi:hypothetical protein
MPTDAGIPPAVIPPVDSTTEIASRRILRMALGTALSMGFSQIAAWPLSFIAPVFTMFLLALPLPVLSLKKGIGFIIALILPVIAGTLFLPFLEYARWVGIAGVGLALYYSFYYTAKGGSPIIGLFMTVGLTLVVTVGSVSMNAMISLIQGLSLGAVFGLVFVWVAHALLPDRPVKTVATAKPVKAVPELAEARRKAWRSLLITFPIALLFMFSSASPSYTVVMIKVATMGQQANADQSRKMGRSLLESTVWGGLGAIIAWQVLSIWPSVIMYVLLIALFALLYGSRIFRGAGMHPKFSMWTYAFLTMIVVLAPAVMDSQAGSAAGAAFYSRLFLIVLTAIYGTTAVAVFDAFWSKKDGHPGK